MSVLPDHEIHDRCASLTVRRRLALPLIEPYNKRQLQPASYDARLSPFLLVGDPEYRGMPLDRALNEPQHVKRFIPEGGQYMLHPWAFLLASTIEAVNIPSDLVGRIEGKSSRARDGIQIHSAGYLDPGFCGNVTLELVNFSDRPIVLRRDMLIAQLSFEYLSEPCSKAYGERGNHYQNSRGTVPAKDQEPK